MSSSKIRDLKDIAEAAAAHRAAGRRVVHCHGVFDLLHIGHIKHLEAARAHGDVLVVTTTPDRFVNKGPGRPAFSEQLRAEALAALTSVDLVAINEWPTAVETIRLIKPSYFVKGLVRGEGPRDHSNAIDLESEAIREAGGELILTDEPTYSSSNLINQHMSPLNPQTQAYLARFKQRYAEEDVLRPLRAIKDLRILCLGETIIDEYQFCDVMGKSNKDPILAARLVSAEKYAGGVLAVANHLAGFCDNVSLLSILGEIDSHEEFIRRSLDPKVRPNFISKPGSPTIVKRRFLQEYLAVKLFEVYVMENEQQTSQQEADLCSLLEAELERHDVVVVADYGHGFCTDRVIDLLCRKSKFLAVNAQTNAGNRGFNLISRYPRADYVSIDEIEARLETRNTKAAIHDVVTMIASKIDCPRIMVTRGKHGCLLHDRETGFHETPAFAVKLVDRIGAGDAVLALTAPCARLGLDPDLIGFIGNVVGAEACAIMGNKKSVDATSVFRHLSHLLK